MQLSRLDDYAENVMSPAFSTIAGVGEVQVLGTKQYAVRIEVDPNATTARGIGLDDLTNAVGGQQFDRARRHDLQSDAANGD